MASDFDELLTLCRNAVHTPRSDSRTVEPGDIFIAVPGENEDGARFIPAAVEAGAAFIVCRSGMEQMGPINQNCKIIYHEDPREALWRLAQARWRTDTLPLKIFGITGTNGKTTVSYLLEHLLTSVGQKTGVVGTIAYRWPGYAQTAPLTTPDVLTLHSLLGRMAEADVKAVVMEVSSHALAQQRVHGILFDGAIFTNLTQDHLDYHQEIENYFTAKAKLFLELPRRNKAMVANSDDNFGRRLHKQRPSILSFGLEPDNTPQLQGKILRSNPQGLHLLMHYKNFSWELFSPLVGRFNASNLLAVQALGLKIGLSPNDFAALKTFRGVCGRLERVNNPAGLNIFVDYAHTPDALVNVFSALREAKFARIIAVFGCGGNRDKTKRPLMGEAVARYADIAVLTSDNPRFENPQAIIDDVLPGLTSASQVHVEQDRRKATALALEMLTPEDVLLIAGKGHEDYQIIQGVKHHYSDQETVRELLRCC